MTMKAHETKPKLYNDNSKMVVGEKTKNLPSNSGGIEETPFIVYKAAQNSENTKNQSGKIPTCKQNLSYYFSQYCSATSIHGVQYLGERGRFVLEKLFWAIIITAVWCVCIFLISKTYNKWVTSPVIVTFATTETSIWEIPFPAVTICPEVKSDPDIFNYTDVLIRKMAREELTADEKRYFEIFSLICNGFGKEILLQEGFRDGNLTVNASSVHDLITASPNFDSILSEIRWLDRPEQWRKLLPPSFTSEGLCFSFNMLDPFEILKDPEEDILNNTLRDTKSKRWSLDRGYLDNDKLDVFPRRTFVSGTSGSFMFQMFTNHSQLDYLCGESLQGFKVTLHHPSEWPNMNKHFRLPLDQVVLVAIKPRMTTVSKELQDYSPENRKCYFTDERFLSLFKTYSQQNCFDECFFNYTLKKCGCAVFYLSVDNQPICGPGSATCVEESKTNYTLKQNSNCNCLSSCTSLEYDVEISQSDWNWRQLFNSARGLGISEIEGAQEFMQYEDGHLSRLVVYYSEMQFLTSERHELYGYVDFFSNTGGLLGLFIGFSFTSFIEILYFLTIRLAYNIRKFGRDYWSGEPDLINAKND